MTDNKNPTGRATEAFLSELHNRAAKALMAELKRAEARAEANPLDPDCAVPPQLLATVTRYLTSNKIDSPAATKRVEDVNAKLAAISVNLDDEVLGGKHTGDARH